IFKEDGISRVALAVTGHPVKALQGGDVEWEAAAVINERVVVQVTGKVEMAFMIEREREVVVAVPTRHIGIASGLGHRNTRWLETGPPGGAESASRHGDASVGIVVGDELVSLFGEKGEADRVARPDAVNELAGGVGAGAYVGKNENQEGKTGALHG